MEERGEERGKGSSHSQARWDRKADLKECEANGEPEGQAGEVSEAGEAEEEEEEEKLARDARTPRLHIIWQRYSHKLGDGPAADAVVYCAFIAAGGGCREPQSPDPGAKPREIFWMIRGMLLLIRSALVSLQATASMSAASWRSTFRPIFCWKDAAAHLGRIRADGNVRAAEKQYSAPTERSYDWNRRKQQ